ncbi:hypothetical protein D9758_002087 [Tetrapyrgos nigripes]|uniref:HMG box domain-containing protein n=1 Tax=Tetrapyrgos nigripes TaxID=182062 RepID=A0A8H5GTA1_9AGAR|nr:hypothetical protein D9758_002087 [Tetrapyrgos nigripes]
MPGPDRNSRSSPSEPEVKIPRPPNAWILFRSDMLRKINPHTWDANGRPTRKTQAVVSKEVADLWKTASPDVRAEYERRADAKKAEHSIQFPNYRFTPLKKEDRMKLKEEKKLLKEQERANKRRARAAPYTPSPMLPPPLPSGTPVPSYPLAAPSPFPYPFALEASPPYSAYASPEVVATVEETVSQTQEAHSQTLGGASLPLLGVGSSSSSTQDNGLMLSTETKQPVAGPSHFHDQDQVSWPGDSSQQPVDPGFVHFDIPDQQWLGPNHHMNAICSTTADPSVYQLAFDQHFLDGAPLELSLTGSLDPNFFPDMRHLDFSSLLDGVDNNFDFFGNGNNADPVITGALGSEYQTQSYNAEEYLNFEQDQPTSSSSSSTQFSTPDPSQSSVSNSTPNTVASTPNPVPTPSYTPPTGAAFSSQRRVAGTWSRSFAVEDTSSPQSQPAQIPTPVN